MLYINFENFLKLRQNMYGNYVKLCEIEQQ